MPACLKTDAIDRAFDFRNSDNLLDLLAQRGVLAQIDDLAAKALGLLEPLRNHVAHDDAGRAEQLTAGRTRKSYWPAASHVHDGPRPYSGCYGAMKTGRHNIRKQRQIADLLHSASFFRQP